MNLRSVAIGASILALVAAGCSASGSPTHQDGVATLSADEASSSEAVPDAQLSQEEAIEAYNACVTDEGLPEMAIADLTESGGGGGERVGGPGGEDVEGLDDGAFDEGTFDYEKFEEVDEKCGHFLETAFGDFEMSPEQEAIMRDIDLAFTKCMKDQGIDMQGMSMFGGGESLDPEDPDASPGGSPGMLEGSPGMLEFAEEDFEKFEEAFKACEHIFEETEKQFTEESEGQ